MHHVRGGGGQSAHRATLGGARQQLRPPRLTRRVPQAQTESLTGFHPRCKLKVQREGRAVRDGKCAAGNSHHKRGLARAKGSDKRHSNRWQAVVAAAGRRVGRLRRCHAAGGRAGGLRSGRRARIPRLPAEQSGSRCPRQLGNGPEQSPCVLIREQQGQQRLPSAPESASSCFVSWPQRRPARNGRSRAGGARGPDSEPHGR